ncbi:EMC3/TMCO1 family protein [Candidatus Woesearchaeota archaeon]|nr:EMC3/TMCO1 family protein [Candidatus Woesearchaeota archaeon]
MALANILDPVLGPLLQWAGPFATLLIVSIIVSVFTTLIHMFATDQEKLKRLKADMKRYQAKLKTLKDSPEKAMKVQKDLMKLNGEFMKSSFKTTFYTIIPLLIFFGWLGANLAFAPLVPNTSFNVSATFQEEVSGQVSLVVPDNLTVLSNLTQTTINDAATWTGIKGPKGSYELSLLHESSGEEQFFLVTISEDVIYEDPVVLVNSEIFKKITIGNEKLYVFRNIFLFKDLPLIKNAGWLGAYILFSLIFSTALRKALKLA